LIEDDRVTQRLLEEHIRALSFLDLVGVCTSISELREILAVKNVDLLILDIGLPDMSGIDFLSAQPCNPRVIMVTGKTTHAAAAFDLDAVDYIVKPVKAERFRKAAEKARMLYEAFDNPIKDESALFVKSDTRLIKLDVRRVSYLEAMGDYVRIHSKEGKFTTLSTMKSMLDKLPKGDFIRAHKSYIVRRDKIQKIDKNQAYTELGTVPVSRTYKEELLKLLPKI
jgi:DNA-binding LytR/AlgR family response regulator